MEKLENFKPYIRKGQDRRVKTSPKGWKVLFRQNILEKIEDKDIKKEVEKEWEEKFADLADKIRERGEEMTAAYTGGGYWDESEGGNKYIKEEETLKSFQDEEFFFKKAYDEFVESVTEDVEDIIGYIKDELSQTKLKELKFKTGKNKQDNEKIIEEIIPGFSKLLKEEKLDVLDGMYGACLKNKDVRQGQKHDRAEKEKRKLNDERRSRILSTIAEKGIISKDWVK